MERLFWTHRFISEVSSSFRLLLLCCYKSSLTDSALLIQVYILSSAQSARTHTDACTKFDECHSVDGWRITAGLFFFCFLTSLCLFKAMESHYFVEQHHMYVHIHVHQQTNRSCRTIILYMYFMILLRPFVCWSQWGLSLDLYGARNRSINGYRNKQASVSACICCYGDSGHH